MEEEGEAQKVDDELAACLVTPDSGEEEKKATIDF
jgi:hypothetical protein